MTASLPVAIAGVAPAAMVASVSAATVLVLRGRKIFLLASPLT